jgi:hypothetical protein
MPNWRRALMFVLPFAVAAPVGVETPGFTAPPKKIAKPKAIASVPGKYVQPSALSTDPTAAQNMRSVAPVTWPAPSTADVVLPGTSELSTLVDGDVRATVAVPNSPVHVGRATGGGKLADGSVGWRYFKGL